MNQDEQASQKIREWNLRRALFHLQLANRNGSGLGELEPIVKLELSSAQHGIDSFRPGAERKQAALELLEELERAARHSNSDADIEERTRLTVAISVLKQRNAA